MRISAAACLLVSVTGACRRGEAHPANDSTPKAALSLSAPTASAAISAAPAPTELGPPVMLDGAHRPVPPALPGSPRVYPRTLRVWVLEQPDPGAAKIGSLRLGSSAPIAGERASSRACPGGYYPILPRGFVCVGEDATLDPRDPVVLAGAESPPDYTRKLPYIYGTVRKPGPIYQRLPSAGELATAEPGHEERYREWLDAGGEIGARYAQHVWLGYPGEPPDPRGAYERRLTEDVPRFLQNGGKAPAPGGRSRGQDLIVDQMALRVGYSFLKTFFWEGRRYGLATDLRIMPTDRLRPIQGSDHHGVRIGVDIDFPFAIVRKPYARYYQRSSGRMIDAGPAPYFTAVKLTGKQVIASGKLHYETADGKWINDREAARIEPAKRMPAWGKNGEKWIDVNITIQRLVLYEGTKPVYATLVSTGEAGLEDPEHTTATKRGIFRIHTKYVTATMDSDEVGEEFELRDVPYVQYFDKQGYALHGAYWHDRFGTPKSHGCINLTPEDARRIFFWTEPSLPPGWHSVLLPLKGTTLFVHP